MEAGLLLRRRALELVTSSDRTVRERSHPQSMPSGEIANGRGESRAIRCLMRL